MKKKPAHAQSVPPVWSPAPGDWVEVDGMRGVARVVELDQRRGRARIELQDRQWLLPLGRLTPASQPPPAPPAFGYTLHGGAAVYHQVDLHGQRVEEALELAERGLDQAVVGRLDRFKIVHGHGSGRLRLAIRRMLTTHPHVDSFRFGEPHEGGLACTVAILKRRD